ncbi:hypothetical protein CesoFtcFv8_013424 [Champsocephalus esox]|uniref:Uncharacterized protein n=1 Tax=Champsocephalus esox TaxID=159716 RepID=A0AAN8BRK8_9TELE|nr:hypothetical protein CesoFtcFv8_013424 [Champsocephalus esox]
MECFRPHAGPPSSPPTRRPHKRAQNRRYHRYALPRPRPRIQSPANGPSLPIFSPQISTSTLRRHTPIATLTDPVTWFSTLLSLPLSR